MVKLSPHVGFCFGVRRSIEIVNDLLKTGEKICTLGKIIHNNRVCENLNLKGIKVVKECDLENLNCNCNLVFRAHGVGPDVYDRCRKLKIKYFDATCPFVKRIHDIVFQHSKKGMTVLIVGDENHSEVKAIKKYCIGEVFVFFNFKEIKNFLEKNKGNFVIVVQTTYSSVLWEQGLKEIERFPNVKIFNTICSATVQRQKAAVKLAKEVDFMIVIGDRHSSNSRKLFELCSKFCNTCFVESRISLENLLNFKFVKNIGIAAGASTPPNVVNEIYYYVKNMALN